MNKTEIADKALEYLRDRSSAWVKTPRIVQGCGIPDVTENRNLMCEVLKRLVGHKRVLVQGSGPYTWKISPECVTQGWESENPFTTIEGGASVVWKDRGSPATEPAPGAKLVRITDSRSFDYRDQIKKIPGAWFDKDAKFAPRKSWYVPADHKHLVIQSGLAHEDYSYIAESPAKSGITEMVERMAEEPAGGKLAGKLEALNNKVEGYRDASATILAKLSKAVLELNEELKVKEDRIGKLERMVSEASRSVKTLKIEDYTGKVRVLKDKVLPKVYNKVLGLARCRRNILLVGPAGCGKSYLAKLVAESLGLKFGKVGGSGGLQEHHLLGWSRPNLTGGKDKFVTTDFLRCFEDGGLCLVDELDAADQNVLLALNPALDHSGDLPIPNRGDSARKHKDFVCCATANTYGRGADRVYAGRNQLDEATLDRFRIGVVECDYDEAVDLALCPHDELRTWCQGVREKINAAKMRRIMSSRFIEDAYVMVSAGGWKIEDVKETFFSGWTRDEVNKVTVA